MNFVPIYFLAYVRPTVFIELMDFDHEKFQGNSKDYLWSWRQTLKIGNQMVTAFSGWIGRSIGTQLQWNQ